MPHDHYIPRVAFRNALRHLLLVVQNGCDGTATIYPDVTYTFDSDLGTGQLHIAGERTERVSARRYLPPWLHVRFDDPKRAAGQCTGPTVNPHSGKWNHHVVGAVETMRVEDHLRRINMRITGSDRHAA